jgi:hypothetical protein
MSKPSSTTANTKVPQASTYNEANAFGQRAPNYRTPPKAQTFDTFPEKLREVSVKHLQVGSYQRPRKHWDE